MKKQTKTPYLLLLPSLLGTSVFVLAPFLDVIRRSFFQAVGGTFVGFSNYRQVLENEAFQQALFHTLRFLFTCLPLLLLLSFLLAVLVYHLPVARPFFEAAFLFPMAIPVASVVVFWRLTFHTDGLFNELLAALGLSGQDWMNTPAAFWVLVFSYTWKNLGYDMILWIAGLSQIPKEQYEAAAVSGAGPLRCFFSITLPQMKSSIAMIGVLSFVNAFRVFREAYLIAGDYPHNSIYMLQHVFNNWFTKLDVQKMTAAAVMLALVISLFLLALELWTEKQEESV
ncbi:MAG: sugar ABC transporter permease [Lachnospiraceae bacterium]|nr:sugar ABC transporter permease [Lachnospiraceae bacterium]